MVLRLPAFQTFPRLVSLLCIVSVALASRNLTRLHHLSRFSLWRDPCLVCCSMVLCVVVLIFRYFSCSLHVLDCGYFFKLDFATLGVAEMSTFKELYQQATLLTRRLSISTRKALMPHTVHFETSLLGCFCWSKGHGAQVVKAFGCMSTGQILMLLGLSSVGTGELWHTQHGKLLIEDLDSKGHHRRVQPGCCCCDDLNFHRSCTVPFDGGHKRERYYSSGYGPRASGCPRTWWSSQELQFQWVQYE